MKMYQKSKKPMSMFLSFCVASLTLPWSVVPAFAAEDAVLTFSDSGITETAAGSGYSIDGTVLTISSDGSYRIQGSCAEGSIVVDKKLSDVTLILDNLTLASSETAPILVKKNSSVTLELTGTSTITDSEDAATEDSNEDFEGAVVKVKSGSTVYLTGDGTLQAAGNAKNGLKGASESSFVMNGGTVAVTAENNGIAFDGRVIVNAGTITVTSGNDGIKAVPDEDDTDSEGTVAIQGGTITIDAKGDGIQAGTDLTITNGTFDIKTLDGYNSSSFDEDTMSCKGLKASGNDEDTENATNLISISGGTFKLNTADDAIHSDGDAVITGGTFEIYTGDDGVHADTSLTLGAEGGTDGNPEFNIYSSYEGLEAGTIYTYSGDYYVAASDDGINAAGGSSNGTEPGGGSHFNPGGIPGGFGGSGFGGGTGSGFGGGSSGSGSDGFGGGGSASGDYSLNFYGGTFYVDCKGDGLDSNGALNLYGGTYTVLSQAAGGDNSPLDSDGTLLIKGATVFAAGTNPMNETPASTSQKYYTDTTNRSAGTVVNVIYGGSVVCSEKLLRNINYLLYSSPEMTTNSCTITTGSVDDTGNNNAGQNPGSNNAGQKPGSTSGQNPDNNNVRQNTGSNNSGQNLSNTAGQNPGSTAGQTPHSSTDQMTNPTTEFNVIPVQTKVEAFVARLYEKCLGRTPDEAGFEHWNQVLISKERSGAQVAYGFVFSKEYQLKNTSDEEYVEMLYNVFMDRASDEGGKAHWLELLSNGVSREYVFRGFAMSQEYTNICNSYGIVRGTVTLSQERDQNSNLTAYVNRLYTQALGRSGEEEGLNHWCKVIRTETKTPEQVAESFINSQEFKNKNLSDEEYIKVLYRTFLGREYDQSGLEHWLGELKRGCTREEILHRFATSKEFKNIQVSFGL